MLSLRPLLPLLCLVAAPAWAATGDVSVVYGEALVGDGQTPATVLLRIEGSAPTDKVKIKAERGKTGSADRLPDGSWLVHLTPPAVEAAESLGLTIKSKGAVTAETTATVPLVPPATGSLAVSFSAEHVRAGDKPVTVTVRPEGPEHAGVDLRSISLRASNGRLSAPKRAGDGGWTATWTPPSSVKVPEAVLFVASDLSAPDRVAGLATLPIVTKRKVIFEVPRDSMNLVFTEEGQQGPLPADSSGEVAFTLEVHPARTTARLQTVLNTGQRTDETVPLDTGARSQLSWTGLPSGVKVGADRRMDFLLAVSAPTGVPWAPAADGTGPQLKVEGPGNPSVTGLGGGLYRVTATAPSKSGAWTLEATLGDRSASQTVTVTRDYPELALVPDPLSLADTTTSVKLTVRAKDTTGGQAKGRRLRVAVTGGAVSGSPVDRGNGTYTQTVKVTSGAEELHVAVRSGMVASGLPVRRVRVWPGLGGQVADGERSFPVFVAAEDAWGMPVPNQSVGLSVALGDASCPETAKTGPDGFAVVTCSVGTRPGPAALVASAGSLSASSVVQLVPVGSEIPDRVDLGSDSVVAGLLRLQAAAPVLRMRRGEVVAVAAADVPMMQVEQTTSGVSSTSGGSPAAASGGAAVVGVTPTPMKWADPSKAPSGSSPTYSMGASTGGGDSQQAAAGSPPAMAAPSGSSSATKQKNSRTGSGAAAEIPMVRVRGGVAALGQRYRATSDGPNLVLPSSASYTSLPLAGGVGVFLSAEGWFLTDKQLGVDLRLHQSTFAAASIGDSDRVGVGEAYVGAAYAVTTVGPLRVLVGGGYQRVNVDVVRYSNDLRDDTDLANRPVNGLRLAGGADASFGPARARVEVGQTFGPRPVWTDLTLGVDVAIIDPIQVYAGYQLGFHYGTYEVGGEESKVRNLHNLITLGAAVTF